MLAHTVQMFYLASFPGSATGTASYEMLGGAWDAGRGLGCWVGTGNKAMFYHQGCIITRKSFTLAYRHRDVAR